MWFRTHIHTQLTHFFNSIEMQHQWWLCFHGSRFEWIFRKNRILSRVFWIWNNQFEFTCSMTSSHHETNWLVEHWDFIEPTIYSLKLNLFVMLEYNKQSLKFRIVLYCKTKCVHKTNYSFANNPINQQQK